MATVNISWSKSADKSIRYLQEERSEQDLSHASNCIFETAQTGFKNVRDEHRNQGGNEALHIVQSFSMNDSMQSSVKKLHSLGIQLAEDNFRSHQFVVKTHTDTEKIHNHIIVNTVNFNTGKKIENKRSLIDQLRNSSDKRCLEQGLSVINREANERKLNIPIKVQQMVRAGKKSYIMDLAQKADVARSIATSHDEYRDVLSGFGIRTVFEEKNISYFYPGKDKGKRGSKLGFNYTNQGLIEAYKENDEKFTKNPELRATLIGESEKIKMHRMPKTPEGVSKFTNLWDGAKAPWKDYTQYTKISRRDSRDFKDEFHSDRELLSGSVPASEINKAKKKSIFDYCKRNSIELSMNERGEKVMKGKEFVTVSEFEFKNGKNGTRGSLIDLVAAHQNKTLLQAVATINHNDRLNLLEAHMGKVNHSYRSFYVPHQDHADSKTSTERLTHFLSSFGANPSTASKLQENGLAQVDKKGSVWLFPKGDACAAQEYKESEPGKWAKKSHGKARNPFFRMNTEGRNRLVVFSDPKMFLLKFNSDYFGAKNLRASILGLFDPKDEHHVYQHVSENPHIKRVHFVTSDAKNMPPVELDLFENLKTKLRPFGIYVEPISHERELAQTIERGQDFGLSL